MAPAGVELEMLVSVPDALTTRPLEDVLELLLSQSLRKSGKEEE